MRTIEVSTPSASYPVHVGSGLLPALARFVGARRVFVLSSPPVWSLWGRHFQSAFPTPPPTLFLPPGEQCKRLSEAERLLEELLRAGCDRSSLLLAFGGGIVGDVGGFLAAIYMRGIPYVQVPTTLLAQVDSSGGGKTGVNLAAGKNLVGAFHHPEAVFADTDLLATLPPRELRAGLMEAVKAALLRDAGFFSLLEAGDPDLGDIVARAVAIKAAVVGADERESGLRMILNLGHTLGHAIEAVTEYKVLLHGEAIGWGMLGAFQLARERGLMTFSEADRAGTLVRRLGMLPPFIGTIEGLLEAAGRDKKNREGKRRFVLPRGIGDAVGGEDVTDAELAAVAGAILSEARHGGNRCTPRGRGGRAGSRRARPRHVRRARPAL